MTSDPPYLEYSKAALPRGLSYVLGRDRIERALTEAGAHVGHLSLGRADGRDQRSRLMVFDVYWVGDGGTRIYNSRSKSDAWRLLMRWNAVPTERRRSLAAEIEERWLDEACAWAAAAPKRGNVWRSTDHRWILWLSEGELQLGIE